MKMATSHEVTIRQLDIKSAKSLAALLKAVLYKLDTPYQHFLVYVDEDYDNEAQEKVPCVTVKATVICNVNMNGYVSPFDDVKEEEGEENGET